MKKKLTICCVSSNALNMWGIFEENLLENLSVVKFPADFLITKQMSIVIYSCVGIQFERI